MTKNIELAYILSYLIRRLYDVYYKFYTVPQIKKKIIFFSYFCLFEVLLDKILILKLFCSTNMHILVSCMRVRQQISRRIFWRSLKIQIIFQKTLLKSNIWLKIVLEVSSTMKNYFWGDLIHEEHSKEKMLKFFPQIF